MVKYTIDQNSYNVKSLTPRIQRLETDCESLVSVIKNVKERMEVAHYKIRPGNDSEYGIQFIKLKDQYNSFIALPSSLNKFNLGIVSSINSAKAITGVEITTKFDFDTKIALLSFNNYSDYNGFASGHEALVAVKGLTEYVNKLYSTMNEIINDYKAIYMLGDMVSEDIKNKAHDAADEIRRAAEDLKAIYTKFTEALVEEIESELKLRTTIDEADQNNLSSIKNNLAAFSDGRLLTSDADFYGSNWGESLGPGWQTKWWE